MDELRRGDLISNREQHFMRFRFPDDWSKEVVFLALHPTCSDGLA